MTDERLEQLRDLARGARNAHDVYADELSELLAEVDRLRAKYEPPPVPMTTVGGGRFDPVTQTLRVPLAVWLEHGPQWVVDFPDLARVELIGKRPWDCTPLWAQPGEFSFTWVWSYAEDDELDRDFDGEHLLPGFLSIPACRSEQAALDALSAALLAWARSPRLTTEDIRKVAASVPSPIRYGGRWA